MKQDSNQQFIIRMRNKEDRLDLCKKQDVSYCYLSQILNFQRNNFKARQVRFHAINDYQTIILTTT